jgi:hypothetical protein
MPVAIEQPLKIVERIGITDLLERKRIRSLRVDRRGVTERNQNLDNNSAWE